MACGFRRLRWATARPRGALAGGCVLGQRQARRHLDEGLRRPRHPGQVQQGRRHQGRRPPARATSWCSSPGPRPGARYFVPLAQWIVSKRRPAGRCGRWSGARTCSRTSRSSTWPRSARSPPTQMFNYYLGLPGRTRASTPHFQPSPTSAVAVREAVGHERRRPGPARRDRRGAASSAARSCSAVTRSAARWSPPTRRGTSTAAPAPTSSPASSTSTAAAGPAPSRRPATRAAERSTLPRARRGWRSAGSPRPTPASVHAPPARPRRCSTPTRRRSAQTFGLLPAAIVPPVPATNLGQFGYALDVETSPAELVAAQAHLGRLASPRSARSGLGRRRRAHADRPLRRRCSPALGMNNADGSEWYFPQRLTDDTGAVGNGNANPAQSVLGVDATMGHTLPKRLLHLRLRRAPRRRGRSSRTRAGAGRAVAGSRRQPDAGQPPGHLRPQRPGGRVSAQRVLQQPDAVPGQGGQGLSVGRAPGAWMAGRRPGRVGHRGRRADNEVCTAGR